jgi:hypothetical protein
MFAIALTMKYWLKGEYEILSSLSENAFSQIFCCSVLSGMNALTASAEA